MKVKEQLVVRKDMDYMEKFVSNGKNCHHIFGSYTNIGLI
jgi:hypothetical protein